MKYLYTCLLLIFNTYLSAQELYFPPLDGSSWETTDPSALGWCQTGINSLFEYPEEEQTKSFILLKDGKIVLEKYFGSYTRNDVWFWFSAGKSLMAVMTGIAQEEGFLSIEDKTSDHLGQGWTSLSTGQEAAITIRDQLTMTSGLNESFFLCSDPECLIYKADPGKRWVYHNGPYSLLRNVIESATSENLNLYTGSRLEQKIGMSGNWIKVDFNNFYVSSARDMARFGVMMLAGGAWNNIPIITDKLYYNDMISSSQDLNPAYGYLWWLNGKSSYILPGSPVSFDGTLSEAAPEDTYTAAGSQGQFISISSENGLIMIRQGAQDNQDLAPIDFLNDMGPDNGT